MSSLQFKSLHQFYGHWANSALNFVCVVKLLNANLSKLTLAIGTYSDASFRAYYSHCKGKYRCMADQLIDWFGYNQAKTMQMNPRQTSRRSAVQWYFPIYMVSESAKKIQFYVSTWKLSEHSLFPPFMSVLWCVYCTEKLASTETLLWCGMFLFN